MKLIAVDLELNQPSGKIIQIGAVCFDPQTGKVNNSFNKYVDPREPLSEEIIMLTRITQTSITPGYDIQLAAEDFTKYKQDNEANPIAVVWGAGKSNDVRKIYEESGKPNPFRDRIIDVKAIFQMFLNSQTSAMRKLGGLEHACKVLGLSWDGKYGAPHNALADAYNTMRVYIFFSKLLNGAFRIKMGL